jgi:CubicO group peptidase (beta-lactamase class C family)
MIKKSFISGLALLSFGLFSQTITAQVSTQTIDSIVQVSMDKFAVAGLAVAVVKDGKIVHQKGYGVKSVETKAPVDENTNFGIASNSKAFTATALAMLVEEGKLTWTDKVVSHIPEFKMYNDYVTQNFNIQDLLTHRSGLGLGIGDLMFFPDGADFTMDDIITSFQHFKPESAFRTKFDYDNLLYLVAGEIIKRTSGMTWEKFVEERIFKPLNMDNSYTSLTYVPNNANVAMAHLNNGKDIYTVEPERWDPAKINGAAAGIYANVNDLANWMLVNLNKGKYGDSLQNQLFAETSQHEMWKIHTSLSPKRNPRYNAHFNGYGLGWFLTDMNGNMAVSHTGGLIGMLSKTILIPDLNLGVVVLTNTYLDGAGVFSAVSQSIVDEYLGLDDFDWASTYANAFQQRNTTAEVVVEKVWETTKKANTKKLALDNYAGVYEDAWFGKINITKKDNKLWFQSQRSSKLVGEMYYYKANTFVVKWDNPTLIDADAFVMFSLDEEGLGQEFKMKGISPLIDFSFDFEDLHLKRVTEK